MNYIIILIIASICYLTYRWKKYNWLIKEKKYKENIKTLESTIIELRSHVYSLRNVCSHITIDDRTDMNLCYISQYTNKKNLKRNINKTFEVRKVDSFQQPFKRMKLI